MGRDVPEGRLAEEEGYSHWTRREPHTETVTHGRAGCVGGKSLGLRVTVLYVEDSLHLF